MNKLVELIYAGSSPEELSAATATLWGEARDTIATLEKYSDYRSQSARTWVDETDSLFYNSMVLNISCFILAAIVGMVLSMMITKAIASPLEDVARKASLVAEGNLDQHFTVDGKDEIAEVANSLGKMVEHLRVRILESEQKSKEAEEQSQKAMQAMTEAENAKQEAQASQAAILKTAEEVEAVVSRLSSSTEELSAQISEAARSAEMQSERVASSATAMEEMNATVLEVAKSAAVASCVFRGSLVSEKPRSAHGVAFRGCLVSETVHSAHGRVCRGCLVSETARSAHGRVFRVGLVSE